MGAPHDLALTAAAWEGEWWRLWSGHLIHYSLTHCVLNAVALLPPLVLSQTRGSLALWSLVAAPALSAALLMLSDFGEFRGASGLVVGAWSFVAVELFARGRWRLALMLTAGLAMKLVLESMAALPWSASVETSHAAHYLGAVLGLAGGAVVSVRAQQGR